MEEIEEYLAALKKSIDFLDNEDASVELKIKTIKSVFLGLVSDVEGIYKNQFEMQALLSEIHENLKYLNQKNK
jgi:hypothetical protein